MPNTDTKVFNDTFPIDSNFRAIFENVKDELFEIFPNCNPEAEGGSVGHCKICNVTDKSIKIYGEILSDYLIGGQSVAPFGYFNDSDFVFQGFGVITK